MASSSRALRLLRLAPRPAAAASRLLRPLAAAPGTLLPAAAPGPSPAAAAARGFATQAATSSLKDSSPNWNNRPPKETILLDGCDFEHWLVVMDPPPGPAATPDVPREEIIDTYIKTLAQVVGSEEEARMKIYSVSTRHYFAFGAQVPEELSLKIKELPKVRWVLPDSYLDVKNKDYGGEPFIDGKALPYDPKYHEEWVNNNIRANERSRRPRSFDNNRSRGFDRSGPARPPPSGQNQMPPQMRPAQGPAGAQQNYQPHAPTQQPGYGPGGGPNYPNAPPPGYQPGNHGYQGNPVGNMQSGPGPAHQGNNPPPFPGSNQPPPYNQAGNPGYQGNGNYNNAAPPAYEGRDGPGRHYQ